MQEEEIKKKSAGKKDGEKNLEMCKEKEIENVQGKGN